MVVVNCQLKIQIYYLLLLFYLQLLYFLAYTFLQDLGLSLELGHVITTRGGEVLGIHEEANYWIATKRLKEPVALTSSWQDMDKQLSDLLHETSDEIEAFDLVNGNQDAHDFLIDLEHDISVQVYPDDQPMRVTFLLGRLLRVLAITEFALENEINSFSATKQSMVSPLDFEILVDS